ncbi:DNA-binding transcriptional response regulator, NtrC family, contains REC, AAA-type ATPase, and a Fis-type DNA-binding domains [Algoriphagus ornithinivorans]|uniref:DNA-binding transcriptional response regulator, NtrC family, contains REC, AAA-type ATPase, and a Fis-type DNA-binding domains n=3 Tax=Algoriphagus TaxID=246875 RepID=A0A1I5B3J6_9BACT|nr:MULTISPECIES: sigma-54 dependent transcriptional regulator [Algoriphagus]MAL13043.1 sigma-54-dependent Fis family transcriptional regulator [Algoriphagus sp.]MAN85810.1 sigma-54-dependent Fis family transcriptional regulator [Algoriphagus sp.]QYH39397.1 sigma-54-dependent Fis family transcriptional regulator [Algoriphagus sp. NBT04N3]SFN69190.1 DNA-binding transcriptional response regulator, NtrC family, contains REC, AAA-type ATPase, and a Fis-type DNA-binding domains [Algoriphagus ornithin
MENQDLGKILIIDDNEDLLFAAKMLLKKHAKEVTIEKDPRRIPFLINNNNYDVILLDMNFREDTTSGKEGFFWLSQIKEIDPKAVVILITAFGDVEMAVQALKEGATDFILKPWQNEKLLATLSAAVRLKESYNEVDKLQKKQKQLQSDLKKPYTDIIGSSASMKNIFSIIDKVAQTDANVLILGENGTGKELIARAIHERSLRKDEIFVGVDMGAITETLFESELFGHKRGAFTDAKDDRAGRFEIADKGTLFLDEIGNLSMPLQSKLLTVLQKREVTRIGTNKAIPVDIRLICATNMHVHEMVMENTFRQDLLYRINTVEIFLPPLRERQDDIPQLANHFLKQYSQKYRKEFSSFTSSAMELLQRYPWPGNIRELQHAIERAIIMAEGNQLDSRDFFFLSAKPASEKAPVSNTLNLDDMERSTIQRAIDKNGGNISKAAKELGLTRASLYRRLEKYGL